MAQPDSDHAPDVAANVEGPNDNESSDTEFADDYALFAVSPFFEFSLSLFLMPIIVDWLIIKYLMKIVELINMCSLTRLRLR